MDCLRGEITVRELRMRIENLPPDRVLQEALGESRWLDEDWLLYDIANNLRFLKSLTYNVNRGQNAPMDYEPLPAPDTKDSAGDTVTAEQAAAEAELSALVHRKG